MRGTWSRQWLTSWPREVDTVGHGYFRLAKDDMPIGFAVTEWSRVAVTPETGHTELGTDWIHRWIGLDWVSKTDPCPTLAPQLCVRIGKWMSPNSDWLECRHGRWCRRHRNQNIIFDAVVWTAPNHRCMLHACQMPSRPVLMSISVHQSAADGPPHPRSWTYRFTVCDYVLNSFINNNINNNNNNNNTERKK